METLWTRSESKQWCWTLFVGTLTVYAARVALPICAVSVAKDYNWTKTDSGSVLSSFFWGYATTQVLGGYLADRYGGENVLAVSTLFWATITLFTPMLFDAAYAVTTTPIPMLVALRIAKGVSQGFHFPCMARIISRHLTLAEKGRVFGIVMAGSHAGTVICGSVGSFILDAYGWRSVFHFIGVLGFCWWAFLRHLSLNGGFAVRRRRRRRFSSGTGSAAGGEAKTDMDKPASLLPLIMPSSASSPRIVVVNNEGVKRCLSAARLSSSSSSLTTTAAAGGGVPWLALFTRRAFWAAICAHYCGANAYFTMFSWLPSYFYENYPGAKGWVFNVMPNIAIATTAMIAPPLSMKLIAQGYSVTTVRKLMESGSLTFLAACLLIVSQISSYEAALVLFSAGMAFRGFHHAGVAVNPQDFAPEHTGAVFGFMNTAAAIPGFVGVYVAGYILQWSESWAAVFGVTAVQCLVGAVVYAFFATADQII